MKDVEIIGVDADGLSHSIGAGIFGYDTPDGSLGRSAFLPPQVFANRARQGVFWQPYSQQAYEAAEPEMQWALEKRPGISLFPGSYGRGTVLVGPAMGSVEVVAAVGGLAIVGLLGMWLLSALAKE
jgi:hypothetical protein